MTMTGIRCIGRPHCRSAPTRAGHQYTRSHHIDSLTLEYGTLVPMRYMNQDRHFKVVSVAAWCAWHDLNDSRKFGEAVREAIEKSDSKVMVLASGSLSHRFQRTIPMPATGSSRSAMNFTSRRTCAWWTCGNSGDFRTFTEMFQEYAYRCHGEGWMHDTAMLLGMLGLGQL